MSKISYLAEKACYPVDDSRLNRNEAVVGGTGTGKTFSLVYPRLLHTTDESLVIPVVKRETIEHFAPVFRSRGYEVECLDFFEPENGTVGFDPMLFFSKERDAADLADAIVMLKNAQTLGSNADPYWDNASMSLVAAEILLAVINADYAGKRRTFLDVLKIQENIRTINCSTNLDEYFEKACAVNPKSRLKGMLKSFRQLPERTINTVFSTLNTTMDRLFSEEALQLMEMERQIDFRSVGRKKTALFIQLPLQDINMQRYINIFYHILFKELFEEAEKSPEHTLPVRVHCILDDFAVAGKIAGFEEYISIFRATGISVTLLLQSESQLAAMYGESSATTILNNCDTYVYTGGQDVRTCENVAKRLNRTLHTVLNMELEQFAVFQRGHAPVLSRRYQTLEDPLYREMMENRYVLKGSISLRNS